MDNPDNKDFKDNENPLSNLGIFKDKGQHYNYIYQKSQRLGSALYLVTGLIKDIDPLKWRLREAALDLLSQNLSLTNSSFDERKSILSNVASLCLEIVSMSEIGHSAGIISTMNFNILRKEFFSLIKVMEDRIGDKELSSSFVLSDSFFKVDENLLAQPKTAESQVDKGHNKDVMSFRQNVLYTQSPKSFENKPKEAIKDKKTDRQKLIIDAIKRAKEVTIKDLLSVISDCSEKTIQRELLSLVDKGVLRKVGERRWSKYTLK